MAIFHLSVKTISRSDGRSATAAAAYRAGEKITDDRTGEIHNYSRKGGVESVALVLPENAPDWAHDRSKLWNAAEQSETRKNSTVAREFEIALPEELDAEERKQLAHAFAKELVAYHGFAADVAVHAPSKEGDSRNHHAHILLSTRRLKSEGFTEKTRELDDKKTGVELITGWRKRFATMINDRLQEKGISTRVDHRSLQVQGIDRLPTQHLGADVTALERRTGEPSDKRQRFEAAAAEHYAITRELNDLTQQDRASNEIEKELMAEIVAEQRNEEEKAAKATKAAEETERLAIAEKAAQEARERAAAEQARHQAEIAARQAQTQPQQQEKPAFRHDMDYNKAVAVFEAKKAIPKNLEALQKVPGMEKYGAEDMKALAYQRGMIQERDKNLPPAEQAGKLAKFDNLAATNPEFVKGIRELNAEEKPVDRGQQQDDREL